MNIGFDLDGIFIDRPPFVPRGIIEWLYRGPQNHEPRYRFPSTTIEQFIRKFSHHSIFRPKILQSIEFLKNFSGNKKNTIFLISSRYHFIENETLNILEKYHLDKYFTKIYLNTKNEQPHLFKSSLIRKLKIDVFIDDDLELLTFLKKSCPKTKLFWYNLSNTDKTPDGIIHIKKLEEIYPYLT